MDKINPVSVGGLILMGIKSASLTSLLSIMLLCMILCLAIELHDDFYLSILQPIYDLLYVTRKRYTKSTNSSVNVLTSKTCSNIESICYNDEHMLLRSEVELVLERLGLKCDANGDKLTERFGAQEIASLFSENAPSLEEVKQAFDLFDENNDGYIDEKELKKILRILGFNEYSDSECQRMIRVYDDNQDGLMDFSEFTKLVEDSFC